MVSSDRIVAYRYLFKMPKIYECRRSYTTPRGKPSPTRKIQHRGGPDREESQVLTRQFSGGISPSPGGEARRCQAEGPKKRGRLAFRSRMKAQEFFANVITHTTCSTSSRIHQIHPYQNLPISFLNLLIPKKPIETED